ncbi:hypothetical protein ACFYPN_13620, partial [Streptomyces sp. NPDC005576]|uniref:hypothetical protein n=1 Tax=Streptomyces sp. NPDC005576 TaxID=3364726 RepID=UPI003680E9EA
MNHATQDDVDLHMTERLSTSDRSVTEQVWCDVSKWSISTDTEQIGRSAEQPSGPVDQEADMSDRFTPTSAD